VLLEERPARRIAVDVALFDLDALLFQITSGVAAGRSGRLPEKRRLGHGGHSIAALDWRLTISDCRSFDCRLSIVD